MRLTLTGDAGSIIIPVVTVDNVKGGCYLPTDKITKQPSRTGKHKITTVPLNRRAHKVSRAMFGTPCKRGGSFSRFIDSLPRLLAAEGFRSCVNAVVRAREKGKPVIAMLGGHVVKCGCNPVLIDLMQRRVITALAMNGAASIHDFEIALIGKTSEDVQKGLEDGTFGMARETGVMMNEALARGVEKGMGAGRALGDYLQEKKLLYADDSLLARAACLDLPATVHIAIGTDIIHQHPQAEGRIIGEASMTDFHLFTELVGGLGNGGVILNFGSAVIMPEVFLKALTIARNTGRRVRNFTAATFDMLLQYRAMENVVKRPVAAGGSGHYLIGHHEIMIPLFARAVIEGQI